MHHGVAWAIVQRLLVDAPSVEDEGEGSTATTETQVTTENAASILQQINSIIR